MKINNYLNFILESESNKMRLFFSDKFKALLNRIKDSKRPGWSIAESILKIENKENYEDVYTLIDITDKNDIISFIQVNRIERKYGLDDKYKAVDKHDDFWKNGRTQIKIGRWVKHIYQNNFFDTKLINDSEVEHFVNVYKASFDTNSGIKFEMVSGDEIKKWYSYRSYKEQKGQLGNSCMKYDPCQNYLGIYTKNEDVCKLLILKDDQDKNKITGRALIWQLSSGEYYMDRIYCVNDHDKELFIEYANKNNFLKFIDIDTIITVSLGNYDYEMYPYMDTFEVYNPDTKTLSNDEALWPGKGYIRILSTNGDFESGDVVWSNWDEGYIPKDRAIYCKYGEDWCLEEDAIFLRYRKEYSLPTSDVVWSEYHIDSYLAKDVVHSSLMNDWLYKEDKNIIEIEIDDNGNTDYVAKTRNDLYNTIDNRYVSKDFIKDPYDESYHFKHEMIRGEIYSTIVLNKIKKELLIGNIDTESIKNDIINLYKNNKFNKSNVIDEISKNDIFKEFKYNVIKPTKVINEERMIIGLLSYIFVNSSKLREIRTPLIQMVSSIDEKSGELYQSYYHHNYRNIDKIISISKTFDYSTFGPDIYKRYLLLTL